MPPATYAYDVLILGAGAAGLLCAIEAGKRGRRVAVLDHADRIGKKILISGGGRCNFINVYCTPQNFLSANPHFVKSALARYTPADFLSLVEKHRIPFHEKTLGQLFCNRTAHDIVSMLETECQAARVHIYLNRRIRSVQHNSVFRVRVAEQEYSAPALVVATGGLSIPKMGATSFGYDLARQFAIDVRPCRPALVPLTFAEDDRQRWCDLSGVSAEVVASVHGQSFREKMLFTHRGLSGPAILQISSYWQPSQQLFIDLAPGADGTRSLRSRSAGRSLATAKDALRNLLSQRLTERWLDLHSPADWTNRSLLALEEKLHAWLVHPSGTEGYAKAEVTAGGVATDELSARTMESRKVPGLFFIGEVVDVTGHLGGFNFQWAWASGFCAGQAV